MIGRIAGRIDYRAADHVLIDVGGVGYLVFCSDRTLSALPNPGETAALYTDLLVREDLLQLYGFSTLVEKEWHRLLMSVQGIGAKASLAILGLLGPDGVARAIALGDVSAVKAAKGIGPKTAQRIVLELKGKAPDVMSMTAIKAGAPAAPMPIPTTQSDVIEPMAEPTGAASQAEALSALTNLGYAPADAAAAIAQAMDGAPEVTTPELIKAALRNLAPKS
ncbi:MAG: Holliday junction branch migration protein RuvA [Pseudomonadota bacterium]